MRIKNLLTVVLLVVMGTPLWGVVEEEHPVVILGSGVAALTSATYLARGGITPIVISGAAMGGAITQSHCIQNWPGELSITGLDLSEKIREQAEVNGAVILAEEVVSVDFSRRPFLIRTKPLFGQGEEKLYKTNACIIGLGAVPKKLGIPGESGADGYWSRGVYSCAVCDGSLYKDGEVAVVGGGDSALTEALYLSGVAKKVHLIVRGNQFRAVEVERIQEVLSLPNITVHYGTTVEEIKGDAERVTHLLLQQSEGKKLSLLRVDALFLAIGALPNTQLFQGQLDLDSSGYIQLTTNQQTSVEGVYAIGDVADPEFKQAVSAAGDGAKAALQAQKFVARERGTKQPVIAKQPHLDQVIEVNSLAQFEAELKSALGPIFVDFYSEQCPPCRAFSPTYESWAREWGGKIKFLKVSPEKTHELFIRYQIRAVPTLLILDGEGRVIRKQVGSFEIAEVSKRLNTLKDLPAVTPKDFDLL